MFRDRWRAEKKENRTQINGFFSLLFHYFGGLGKSHSHTFSVCDSVVYFRIVGQISQGKMWRRYVDCELTTACMVVQAVV